MEDYIKETQKQREIGEVAVFWEEISKHLPRSRAREELGDEVICGAFRAVYPKIKSHLLTEARKKWLEEEIEKLKIEVPKRKSEQETHCTYNDGARDRLEDQISRLETELISIK